jgi:hypothetical protein
MDLTGGLNTTAYGICHKHRTVDAIVGPTDKDSWGAKPSQNGFPTESLVEGFAMQSLAERCSNLHCTCV